jgi:pimeloyl-ACP methyl ester carboxylesterase
MASITQVEADLLATELPPPQRIVLTSTAFPAHRGVIEYRCSGPVDAPAIVLLHGLGSSSAGYRAQLAGLSGAWRVIAWDAPGFANSTCLEAHVPTAADYARALSDFCTALGIRRIAVLAGSSWGSVIASAFASSMPERLGALLLSVPNTARGRLAGTAREQAMTALLGAANGDEDRAVVASRLLARDAPAQVRALVERLRDAVTPGGWCQAAHMLFSVYTPDLLAHWHGPTLIVAGTEDKVAPIEAHAEVLLKAMPHARLERLAGYGHMPKLEAPARFNSLLGELAAQSSFSPRAA